MLGSLLYEDWIVCLCFLVLQTAREKLRAIEHSQFGAIDGCIGEGNLYILQCCGAVREPYLIQLALGRIHILVVSAYSQKLIVVVVGEKWGDFV